MSQFIKHQLYLLVLLFLSGVFADCSKPTERQLASERVEAARQMIADNRFNAAKLQLDSVHLLYPRCVEQRKTANHLKDTIMLVEAERTLQYYDSLLEQLQLRADSVMTYFDYDKDERYQTTGNYVNRSLSPKLNNGNFLQAQVSDAGELVLRSFYTGEVAINHTGLKISVADNFTQLRGSNYHFLSDGHHEILTCQGEQALQALQLIAAEQSGKITVTLIGDKKNVSYQLSDNAKKALTQTLQLYYLLSDIKSLEQAIYKSNQQIQLAQKHLNENQTE